MMLGKVATEKSGILPKNRLKFIRILKNKWQHCLWISNEKINTKLFKINLVIYTKKLKIL